MTKAATPPIEHPEDLFSHPLFFVGIGGSGMLPLAHIALGRGARVAGSDRSRDQGRTPEKFAALETMGVTLYPQDGSGVTSGDQIIVASTAVEDSVPEMVRARELGCRRVSRAELNAMLFNTSDAGIAVAGTSGKSTVTAMLGWILTAAGRAPTIMNGAAMKNFTTPHGMLRSAVVGEPGLYVSEVDESDGSIALYRPDVGLLLNLSLDHMSLDALRALFGAYLAQCRVAAINSDDPETLALVGHAREVVTFGIDNAEAMIGVELGTVEELPRGVSARVVDRRDGSAGSFSIPMPGRHNVANALAAIAGAAASGIEVREAARLLNGFQGISRRFDIIGTSPSNVTVIDDFGHNPEKCAATLRTLKAHPGHVLAFFQPHGYGPLRQMGAELAETFARELGSDDLVLLCDPVYFGGTVDRAEGSERVVKLIEKAGGRAEYVPNRETVGERLVGMAQPYDRIVVMGARDDTLTEFARSILNRLP